MMTIQTFVFNPFQENTIVAFDETKEAVVIDPGCYEPEERKELDDFISTQKLTVKYLLNTHCHIDHVLGNDYVKEKYKVKLLIHAYDEPLLRAVKNYAPNYGFAGYREALPDQFLKEGDTVQFGNTTLNVLFLPGHSPGHIGFYNREQKVILSGDVLFEGSIGRTDLPGGDFNTLLDSIHRKLFTLPDDVVVYPGHGGTTTLGEEKISNPFCALSLR
ncbi:MAG TPA: MBL fold metallo-hydrolase [Cyclobacteriaceae bacterium]|nr:MBL fold metallo-hydrolase [Cyclobacteriaceae bacterium]